MLWSIHAVCYQMLPLHLAIVPVFLTVSQSLFSFRSPQPLFRNSLIRFFAP